MTIYRARKISYAYYLAAAVLLFVCLLTDIGGWPEYLLYAAIILLAILGYRIAIKYSRCPQCGHVLQVGLFKLTQCAFCNHPITDQTSYRL